MESIAKWMVKRPDGSTFGPAPLEELCVWARDGRIGPEDEVSADESTWQPAPSLEALGMVWTVDLGDDQVFGPLNGVALANLVREGALDVNLPAHSSARGSEPLPVGQAAMQFLLDDRTAWEDQVLAMRVDLLHQAEQEREALREEHASAVQRAQQDAAEQAGRLQALQSEVDALQQTQTEANEQTATVKKQVAVLSDQLAATQAEQTERDQRAEEALAAERAVSTTAVERAEAAETDLDALRAERDQSRQELTGKEEELEKARAEWDEERKDGQATREQAETTRTELDQRVTELEAELQELRRLPEPNPEEPDAETGRGSDRLVRAAVQKMKSQATRDARRSSRAATASKRAGQTRRTKRG